MHLRVALAGAAVTLALAAPAQAARTCGEPADGWERAAPADVGMDAQRLQQALDYGSSELGFAVRVFRHGCLVGEDRLAAANRTQTSESWSLAKSITSLVFGRAMTLGLISPDDPVGSLVPEADRAHGAITARDLLTMTSGLRWNGLRDYNIMMPDRLRDALTVDVEHAPGTYFEYSQSGPALLAEAVQRAVGEDFQAFAQRELFTPLGIAPGSWSWKRDAKGHTQGFFGVQMVPDDYGRLGDLMRRGGVWRGRRLLAERYVRESVAPSATNGCYGWLIWVNAAKPCIGPRISERPVHDQRDFPDLPADLYRFSGLFGQLVTVLPTQDVVVVRTGQDKGLVLSGGSSWEHDLYAKVLAAVTDQRIEPPGDAPRAGGVEDRPNADQGFQDALREPDQYTAPYQEQPLPPAGPERARAVLLRLAHGQLSRTRIVSARLTCPARAPRPCAGTATLERAKAPRRFTAQPGRTVLVRFRLARHLGAPATLALRAVNEDATGGTPARVAVTVRPARRR